MQNKKTHLVVSGISVLCGLLMLAGCHTTSTPFGRAPLTQEETEQILQAIGNDRLNCSAAATAADRIFESTDEQAKKNRG